MDDDGRPLCPKEAFRYLSHKFHGKGPGKNKQEKRIKKAVQEGVRPSPWRPVDAIARNSSNRILFRS